MIVAAELPLGHITPSVYKTNFKHFHDGALMFWGDEDYLKELELYKLRRLVDTDTMEFNYAKLDFSREATMDDLKYEVSAISLMGGVRLIEVRGLDILSLKAEAEKKLLAALDSLGNDIILVLYFSAWECALDKKTKNRKIISQLEERVSIVEFPFQPLRTILNLFLKKSKNDGVYFSEKAIRQMVQQVGSSLLQLRLEYDKLLMFARYQGKPDITLDDVDRICTVHTSYALSNLSDALLNGERDQVMTIFTQLVKDKTEATMIISSLSRTYSMMIAVVSAEYRGVNQNKIAATLGSFDWLVSKYSRWAKRFSPAMLRKSLDACIEADAKVKSSSHDPYLICEQLLYVLLERRETVDTR